MFSAVQEFARKHYISILGDQLRVVRVHLNLALAKVVLSAQARLQEALSSIHCELKHSSASLKEVGDVIFQHKRVHDLDQSAELRVVVLQIINAVVGSLDLGVESRH